MQALQQEEIMNVFFDDWKALGTGVEGGDWSGKVSEGLMLYQAFTVQKYTKDKKISSIKWHPTIYGTVQNRFFYQVQSWDIFSPKTVTKILCTLKSLNMLTSSINHLNCFLSVSAKKTLYESHWCDSYITIVSLCSRRLLYVFNLKANLKVQ